MGQVKDFVVKSNLGQSLQDTMILGFINMARSVENIQRLGRESFLIPIHVFQSTKSYFYHIEWIILELIHGFHNLF